VGQRARAGGAAARRAPGGPAGAWAGCVTVRRMPASLLRRQGAACPPPLPPHRTACAAPRPLQASWPAEATWAPLSPRRCSLASSSSPPTRWGLGSWRAAGWNGTAAGAFSAPSTAQPQMFTPPSPPPLPVCLQGFVWMGVMVLALSMSVFLLHFPPWGSMVCPPTRGTTGAGTAGSGRTCSRLSEGGGARTVLIIVGRPCLPAHAAATCQLCGAGPQGGPTRDCPHAALLLLNQPPPPPRKHALP
jgi:hypothetical protein